MRNFKAKITKKYGLLKYVFVYNYLIINKITK